MISSNLGNGDHFQGGHECRAAQGLIRKFRTYFFFFTGKLSPKGCAPSTMLGVRCQGLILSCPLTPLRLREMEIFGGRRTFLKLAGDRNGAARASFSGGRDGVQSQKEIPLMGLPGFPLLIRKRVPCLSFLFFLKIEKESVGPVKLEEALQLYETAGNHPSTTWPKQNYGGFVSKECQRQSFGSRPFHLNTSWKHWMQKVG